MGRRATIRLRLRTDDLARLFGVTPRTISRWIASGKLPLTGDPIADFRLLAALLPIGKRLPTTMPSDLDILYTHDLTDPDSPETVVGRVRLLVEIDIPDDLVLDDMMRDRIEHEDAVLLAKMEKVTGNVRVQRREPETGGTLRRKKEGTGY